MSQGKHAEARELMFNGALLFFSYNQVQNTQGSKMCLWHDAAAYRWLPFISFMYIYLPDSVADAVCMSCKFAYGLHWCFIFSACVSGLLLPVYRTLCVKTEWKRLSGLLFIAFQQNSAADLSMLVLEVLEKSDTKVEDEILGELQIDHSYQIFDAPTSEIYF